MQQYRKKQEIIDAEQFLGGTTLLGEEIIEHQCDYRMCDLCGGDNQKHLVVSNTNIIITQGNWLVRFREGNRLSYYSNEAFERFFEPVSAPSVSSSKELMKMASKAAVEYTALIATDFMEVKTVFFDGYNSGYKAGISQLSVQPQSEGGLQWVPLSKGYVLPDEEDFLLKFDNGEIRRFKEEEQPFAVATHYLLLPKTTSPSTANTADFPEDKWPSKMHTEANTEEGAESVFHVRAETVEEEWNNFWKGIVCNPDGSINIEQVKKELADFSFVLSQVPKVYCHITGSLLSKVMYQAETVIAKADEYYEQAYEEDRESDRKDLKEQQIAFAEWTQSNRWDFYPLGKYWNKRRGGDKSSTELYELFLTETKQQ